MQEKLPDFVTKSPAGNTYTSIPTTITAIQWTGDNINELWEWIGAGDLYGPIPAEDRRAATPARLYVAANRAWLELEIGEWIIQDSLGFYPCKDPVFRAKYRKTVPDTRGLGGGQGAFGDHRPAHILIQNGEEVRG